MNSGSSQTVETELVQVERDVRVLLVYRLAFSQVWNELDEVVAGGSLGFKCDIVPFLVGQVCALLPLGRGLCVRASTDDEGY